MKTFRLLAASALLFGLSAGAEEAQNMIGRQTQNEGMFVVPAPKAVKIDGDLGEWDLSGQTWSFADISVRDRFSVKTAAMWDSEYLYMSFYWKDPTPLNSTIDPDFDATMGWRADAIQLRVRAGDQVSWVTAWSLGDKRPNLTIDYWETPAKSGKTDTRLYKGKEGSNELGDGIQSAYKKFPTNDGFIHELRIPWKVLYKKEMKMTAGTKIRMGIEYIWGEISGREWPLHRYADNMQPGATSREFYWSAQYAWGDLAMIDHSVKTPRKYIVGNSAPEGTIAINAEVPADALFFTLVLEDAQGNRIRNLAGDFSVVDFATGPAKGGKTPVRIMWDGLDEKGALVPAGTYSVRGLSRKSFGAEYEMCFYNPGTPPWGTKDGKGAWGSDHSRVEMASRSGKNIILACDFVEGGYGVWAMGPDGKKLWSDKRGCKAMSANEKYIYGVPNSWETKEQVLTRLDASNGDYAPFVLNGKARPFALPVREILGEKTSPVLALAAGPETLLAALEDGTLVLLNGVSAEKIREFPVKLTYYNYVLGGKVNDKKDPKYFTPLAFDGKTAWFFRGTRFFSLNVADGATTEIALGAPVDEPTSIALAPNGDILIADGGKDMQIKRYNRAGKLLGRIGAQGGRARQGMFDPNGMREVSSIAVDATGSVWAAEYTDFPRRVSVWKPEGAFLRDYIGNTGYSGTGAFLHDTNPTRAYVGTNEIDIDQKNHTWKMHSVLWNPDQKLGPSLAVDPMSHAAGHRFTSKASGQEREYYFSVHFRDWGGFFLMLKDGESWRPVSAVTTVGRVCSMLASSGAALGPMTGEFADLNGFDVVFWNDENNDGIVQRSECEIIKAKKPTTEKGRGELPIAMMTGWGQRLDPADLSFYAGGADMWKYKPVGFKPNGAPIYKSSGMARFSGSANREAVPVPGEDFVLGVEYRDRKFNFAGYDKKSGKIVWTYANPYHFVHGSHRATMPKPGLIIGPLKIMGVIENCGEGGNVFAIRGNLGQDYYMTTDGLFVASLFQDTRLPGMSLPDTEAKLRGMPMELFTQGAEPFNGWIGRQSDGVVRETCGLPGQASMILTINGLDSIRRFKAPAITVNNVELVAADRANAARLSAATKLDPYTLERVTGAVNWGKIKQLKIAKEGQPVEGFAKLAYDDQNLYWRMDVRDPSPWRNGGKDFTRLFKTGDSIEVQLSPSANTSTKAVKDDLRLLVAPFGGKDTAVMMKRVAPEAPQSELVRYQSPVTMIEYQQVKIVGDAKIKVTKSASGYVVEASVPWTSLGIAPKAGMKMRGDIGFILSDENGTINVARIYWANQDTNLVSDLPHEAEINPSRWGELIFGQ